MGEIEGKSGGLRSGTGHGLTELVPTVGSLQHRLCVSGSPPQRPRRARRPSVPVGTSVSRLPPKPTWLFPLSQSELHPLNTSSLSAFQESIPEIFSASTPLINQLLSTAASRRSQPLQFPQAQLTHQRGTSVVGRCPSSLPAKQHTQRLPPKPEFMSIENLKTFGEPRASLFTSRLPPRDGVVIPAFTWPSPSLVVPLVLFAGEDGGRRVQPSSPCLCRQTSLAVADITSFADPFAEAEEDTSSKAKPQDYIHIRIQRTFVFVFYPLLSFPSATSPCKTSPSRDPRDRPH